MKILPAIRKTLMIFFKTTLGYGYRCNKCDRNARIYEVFASDFGFDYVSFSCPGCHKSWGMEFQNKEIRKLLS